MGTREVYRDDPATVQRGESEVETARSRDLEMRLAVVDLPEEVR